MKRWIAALMMLLMLAGTACADEKQMGNSAFRLLRLLYSRTDNTVVSPISLQLALAMAAEGAEGQTRDELLAALGMEPGEAAKLLAQLGQSGLRLANAVYTVPEAPVREAYIRLLRDTYGAEHFAGSGADAVNAWAAEKTGHLVENAVSPAAIEALDSLMLINTTAMDAQWVHAFRKDNTSRRIFRTPGGEVETDMMYQRLDRAAYTERDGIQLLRMDYRDSGLYMLIALPEEGGMDALLASLEAEGLAYFDGLNRNAAKVRLSMPRCDLSAELSLKEALGRLGVNRAFTGEAEFGGICGEPGLRIDSVSQKVRMQIDEEGTRAAAVTMISMALGAAMPANHVVEFTMDHPFVALVADGETGAVCFAAVVNNPAL